MIRSKHLEASGALSAHPYRNNLIPTLSQEDDSIGKNEDDYDESPIGGDFNSINHDSTSANTGVVANNLLGKRNKIGSVGRSMQVG